MFQVIEQDNKLQLRMSATLESIDQADERMKEYIRARDLPVDLFAMRILLRESLLNAVTHGCGKDSQKRVHFELHVDPKGLTIVVQDDGKGFQWQAHDNREFDDLSGDGGRGIALMHIYANEVVFDRSGTKVTMFKEYNSAPMAGQR